MERFVINYPLDGKDEKLFVEQMDHENHRFSIERDNEARKLYDNNPLIMERSATGEWTLATASEWPLESVDINGIGKLIEKHHTGDAGFETGVNAK